MKFYMTQDEEAPKTYDLYLNEPQGMTDGLWLDGIATFSMDEASEAQLATFQSEFPLEPGGGPILVELRRVEQEKGNT